MLLGLLFVIVWIYVWFKLVASSVFVTGNGIFYSGLLGFMVASVVAAIVQFVFKGALYILLPLAGIVLVVFIVRWFMGKDDESENTENDSEEVESNETDKE